MSRLAFVIAIAGFAIFPACFLESGTRAARPPLTPPAEGPWREDGGQRLSRVPGERPAERARTALTTLGWTVAASSRADEVLATIHDNFAVVRWSPSGWWVRVEQHSDFVTHLQVPTWDHPWEALRLLHLIAPDTAAADGWQPFRAQDLPEQWTGERAETAYRRLLVQDAGLPSSDASAVHLFSYVRSTPMDRQLFEARLRTLIAATVGRKNVWQRQVAADVIATGSGAILGIAVEQKRDPFSVLLATTRFAASGFAASESGRLTRRRDWIGDYSVSVSDHQAADAVIINLVNMHAAPANQSLSFIGEELTLVRRLDLPGIRTVKERLGGYAGISADAAQWWSEHGKTWVASLVTQGAP